MDIADPQELRKLTSATESAYKLILSGSSPDAAVGHWLASAGKAACLDRV